MKSEELDRLSRELLYTMIQVNSRLRDERRWRAVEDLTVPQVILLLLLNRRGPMRTGDIARNLCVTQGVITRMADRLLKRGLVARTRLPEDRRVVLLSLSPRGRRLASQLERERVEEMKAVLRGIPARERRELFDLFARIRDHLESTR
jgi:DNA-binding MarR family transcriptional regulator